MARVYECGYEFATRDNNYGTYTGGTLPTSQQHQDALGNGGARSYSPAANGVHTTDVFYAQVIDGYIRIYVRLESWAPQFKVVATNLVFGDMFTVQLNLTTRTVEVLNGGVTEITGSIPLVPSKWYRVEAHIRVAGAGGTNMELRIDDIPDGSSTSATNGIASYYDQLKVSSPGASTNNQIWVDDIGVNESSYAVAYEGGNGVTPTIGDTATSPNGASGRINGYVGDGVKGILLCESPGVVFTAGNAISDASGWTATISHNERGENRGWCGDGLITYRTANGNGTTTLLTNSAGTQVNNFSYVDDNQNTADYVVGTVPGLYDTYAMNDAISNSAAINNLRAVTYCATLDAVNPTKIDNILRVGAMDSLSLVSPQTAGGSASWRISEYLLIDPSVASGALSLAIVNAAESGPMVST